jgi:Rrf2 family transcriptional regulator, nitric oxide-sensitive transcriptional repressor
MRLLASTDYALRVLIALGESPSGDTINVGTLAESLGGLSRNHLHKIVQDLAALGIVKTIRGAGGGVVLAKEAGKVSIGAVIRALEEDQAIVECFRADHGCCTLEPACRLRPMLRNARESFYATLDAYTLEDCLGPPAAAEGRRRARGMRLGAA